MGEIVCLSKRARKIQGAKITLDIVYLTNTAMNYSYSDFINKYLPLYMFSIIILNIIYIAYERRNWFSTSI